MSEDDESPTEEGQVLALAPPMLKTGADAGDEKEEEKPVDGSAHKGMEGIGSGGEAGSTEGGSLSDEVTMKLMVEEYWKESHPLHNACWDSAPLEVIR